MIYEKVATFISAQFNIDEDEISEDMSFEDLGADEFDISDLVTAIEGEFDIELGYDEISDIKDVAGLVKLVKTAVELSN